MEKISQKFNEYSSFKEVAIRSAKNSFINSSKLDNEWKKLRFHSKPDFEDAINEYSEFENLIISSAQNIIYLPKATDLTIDSIYARDSILVSPKGLIICNMGRKSRTSEALACAEVYKSKGYKIAGKIEPPGTIEGGDFIWIDSNHAAVGLGPRTNKEGINQLKKILGDDVHLEIVELPEPNHPEDVLHLMSIISPIDNDLSIIYRNFMPISFIKWLENLNMKFVEISDTEYNKMGCNVLAYAPRSVIMLDDISSVKIKLENEGCTVKTYKGNEISRKGEGGPTCLIRPLTRV